VSDKSNIYRACLHGMITLFVLHRAGQEPVYGGALSKSLRGLGYRISPGSLYPLLHTLERKRLLRCRTQVIKGRVRKYYQLTENGRACLMAAREDLTELVSEVIFDGKQCPFSADEPVRSVEHRSPSVESQTGGHNRKR
jgi:DNA-binding PadR family transcriptional regulator